MRSGWLVALCGFLAVVLFVVFGCFCSVPCSVLFLPCVVWLVSVSVVFLSWVLLRSARFVSFLLFCCLVCLLGLVRGWFLVLCSLLAVLKSFVLVLWLDVCCFVQLVPWVLP